MKRVIGSIAVVLAVTWGLSLRGAAQDACTVNAGPFCIDGIITLTNNSGVLGAQMVTDPAGNVQELGPLNSNTTKIGVIHSDAPPTLGTTNPNSQVDLNTIWTQSAPATNGDIWFYFAWARDKNTGSGFISIELQQNQVAAACAYATAPEADLIASCNPWANRSAGDFILLWDQQGGSRDIYKRIFVLEGGNLVLGPAVLLTATTSAAEYSADGFRGEAAVNLTEEIFPEDGSCLTFANTLPGTVTGNSDTADYKDAVIAAFQPIANCGSIIVTKATVPTGLNGSFPYTVARGGALLRFDSDAADYPEDGAAPQTQIARTLTSDGDSETHADLIAAADYTLVEGNVGPTFELVSIVCTVNGASTGTDITAGGTFAVEVGKITRCLITNRLAVADLKIIKTVVNGFGLTRTPGDFTFSRDSGAAEPFANGGTSCTSGAVCKTISYAIGANFTVAEVDIPQGYTMTSAVGCSGTIVLAGNTCTITNTAQPAQPSILTVQRVILHDSANIAGVRRVAGDSLSVTFVLYPSLATCTAGTNALYTEVRPVGFNSPSATSGTAATSTGHSVEANAGPYFWKVTSAGNAANSGFISDCGREQTAITFTYQQ